MNITESPIVKARHAALDKISAIVGEFVEDYEYYGPSGEGIAFPLDEEDHTIIRDAIEGLHADEAFVAAWDAWRALCRDDARVGRSQGVTLSATMLLEALEFIAPDRATDKDQLDTEVAIAWRDATPKDPAGYYAWLAEYPEEGAIPIGTSDADGTETSDGGDEPSEERKQNPLGLKLSLTCCKCDQPATIHGGRSYCRDHDPDMGVSI